MSYVQTRRAGFTGYRRGLGAALANISPRDINNCSGGWYYLLPPCWAYSQSAWQQMGQFAMQAGELPQPTPPPAVTDFGFPSVGAGTQDQASAATDAALAASKAATNTNLLAAFRNMLPVGDGSDGGGGLSMTAMIAIGLAAGGVLLLVSSGGRRRR